MARWLVDWSLAWLVGWLGCWLFQPPSWGSKIVQVGFQNHQVGSRNRLKLIPRGLLEGSWGCQEASWRGLGGLLGPRGPQERKNDQKVKIGYAPWGPSWSPKSIKNRSRCDPKGGHFFIDFWTDFGSDLVPSWLYLDAQNPPKMESSWLQNRSKSGC